MARKKRGGNSTPRRKSTRQRMRTAKGQFYDEHFDELSAELDGSEEILVGDLTPAIGNILDTTKDLEERVVSNDNMDTCNGATNSYLFSESDEPVQFLENVYRLYQTQPVLMNYVFFNTIDTVTEGDDEETEPVNVAHEVHVAEERKMEEPEGVDREFEGDNASLLVKLKQKNHECDLLSKHLFEKTNSLKILTDRVHQLENENEYRVQVVRLEELVEEKEREYKRLQESVAGELQDKNMKNAWLGKVIEENQNTIECMKEQNSNNEDKIVILKEAVVLKDKEIKKMKGMIECAEKDRSETARMKTESASNAAEVGRLLGVVESKEREIMKLESATERSKKNRVEVLRLEKVVEEKEAEIQDKTNKINELQGNVHDCQDENLRLRTENTVLKNKGKADYGDHLVRESPSILGGAVSAVEMAETLEALTDAIASMNTRLVKQENLNRGDHKFVEGSTQTTPPQPPPRSVPSTVLLPPRPFLPPKVSQRPPPPPPPPLLPPNCEHLLPQASQLQPVLVPTQSKQITSVPMQQPQTSVSSSPMPKTKTFAPSVHSEHSSHQSTCESPQPSSRQNEKVRQFDNLPTTMIITDSMAGKININQIKDNIDSSRESVIFKRFPGHSAEEMAFYAPKPLQDCKPEQVIVIAGTNSLTRALHEKGKIDEYEVVDSVLKIARAAVDQGAKKVYISGIMVRRGNQYRDAVSRVNNLMYMACLAENFVFMHQDDIRFEHISPDGIHLNYYGTAILKKNILSVFQTFDPNLMNFEDDYKKALY